MNTKVEEPQVEHVADAEADAAAAAASAQARFGMFGGVFTPCVLTILGVIMFMRTGYVVGYGGLWLSLSILALSKLITTLTALSISAIATNIKMKGGGVYYMISRVLGPDFGGSIGITLYLAQAVGVAFYVIGFTEALFSVLNPFLQGWGIADTIATFHVPQILATVVVFGLFSLTSKGADLAIKTQYWVLGILLLSIAAFMIGGFMEFDSATLKANSASSFTKDIKFWTIFAIFFPATTGITAGANMSGDLKNPASSLPWGTLLAIVFTAAIYITQIVLMAGGIERGAMQAQPFETLQQMSLWGPLILLGVFAATLSSALGSFLGAPRILQAMGQDRLMKVLGYFAKGEGATNEPKRATNLTFVVAVAIIWAGDLNAVAEVISMFFLIAYGMINLSAFVESKSGNPSFRPTFKYFHWVSGMAGAVGCGYAMVRINVDYAMIAVGITAVIYFYLKKRNIKTDYGDAKRGFIFQRTKDNLHYLQDSKSHPKNWRPILLALLENPGSNHQLVRTAGWLESGRGLLTVAAVLERRDTTVAEKLRIRESATDEIRRELESYQVEGFAETLVTDEYFAGVSDFLQSYSVGPLRPNSFLMELPPASEKIRSDVFYQTLETVSAFNKNLVIYKPGEMQLEKKGRRIDLWWRGEQNGSLMAVFGYLIVQHPAMAGANLRLMRIVGDSVEAEDARRRMEDLKKGIRIDAAVEVIVDTRSPWSIIKEKSTTTDLVILGMSAADVGEARQFLNAFEEVRDQLPPTILVRSNGEADIFA